MEKCCESHLVKETPKEKPLSRDDQIKLVCLEELTQEISIYNKIIKLLAKGIHEDPVSLTFVLKKINESIDNYIRLFTLQKNNK